MTVRALDKETGDIVTSGDQFLYEKEDVAQTIVTRLKLFYGEYFRNIQEGTPWTQVILAKGSSLQAKNTYIRQRIRETEEVEDILRYESDYDIDKREYTITNLQVLTSFGLTDIERLQELTPLVNQEVIGG